MSNYYSEKLNSNKLQRCYEVAPIRVKKYLEAEIEYILNKTNRNNTVLDLGCGYGRVAIRLAEKAKQVVCIDISKDNIELAKELYGKNDVLQFHEMNALSMTFPDNFFDITICVQNGISAFKVDPKQLIRESLRVTKKGGILLFSTYSEKFWTERINWFQIQAEEGLIGEIDYALSGNGIIVCKDGFKAITYSSEEFLELASRFNVATEIFEIDESSVFCEMKKK